MIARLDGMIRAMIRYSSVIDIPWYMDRGLLRECVESTSSYGFSIRISKTPFANCWIWRGRSLYWVLKNVVLLIVQLMDERCYGCMCLIVSTLHIELWSHDTSIRIESLYLGVGRVEPASDTRCAIVSCCSHRCIIFYFSILQILHHYITKILSLPILTIFVDGVLDCQ